MSVKDANGCLVVSTVNITEPPAIIANTNPVSSTCGLPNGLASVIASGGTGALTYNWSPPGGAGQTITGLAANSYTVTVSDASGCAKTAIAVVKDISGGKATATVLSDVVCNGGNNGSATVSINGGSPGYTYLWSNGDTSQTLNNLGPGTYTVTTSDASTCTSTGSVTITEPPAISLPAPVTANANCGVSNGSAIASASGGFGTLTYKWSNGANGATANNLSAGSYTVTVNDANGCSVTSVANVSNNGGPSVISITPADLLCKGANTGSAVISVTSGNTPYTYSWSNGVNSITSIPQSTISGIQAATYTVTVKDANNCQVISTVVITEPAAITTTFVTSNAACGQSNGSATVTATGGSGTFIYLWNNGSSGQTAGNLVAASYTVTVTDGNGCTMSSVTNVLNIGAPSAIATVATPIACNGGSGSVMVTVTGGTGPFTYSWSNGSSSTTSVLQSVLNAVSTNSYIVTVTDSKNCIVISTVTLSEPDSLIAIAESAPSECGKNNGFVVVSAKGGIPGYVFNWSNGAAGLAVVNLPAAGYTVTVTDSQGCTTTSSTSIADSTFTLISNVPAKQTISQGTSVDIIISGAVTYSWTPATGLSCTDCPNPTATPAISTVYTVSATDAGGCTVILMINIIVKTPCIGDETDIYVANVFSPNNDGKNDILYIQGNGLANIYWAIYDRWGNMLFESFDQAHGWDGTKKGSPLDSGVYVYYLKATCVKTNSEVKLKGNVSIVR